MKLFLLTSLVVTVATLSFGDVAVYNGIEVIKTTSLSNTSTVVKKTIEVADLANSNLVVIELGFDKATRKNTFSVGAPSAVLITSVQDSRGGNRSFTTFAEADNSTDPATGITSVSSFLQSGQNLQVVINGTQKTALPKNMHGVSWIVATAGADANGPIPSAQAETVETLVLQEKSSQVSNNAGDTLSQAVDRIKADLVAKGYVDVTPAP